MNETVTIEISKDEAAQLSALIDECLAAMRKAHEQMARDQEEIDRLKAETKAIIAGMSEDKLNVEKIL